MVLTEEKKAQLKAKLEIISLKAKLIQEQLDLLIKSDKGYQKPKLLI